MNVAEQDYRIWKNENFVIEYTVTSSLWDEILINDFHEKLNKVLDEINEQTGLISNNSKTLISISFSGDKEVTELNNCFRKKKSATNVLSFPSNNTFNNTLFLGDIIFQLKLSVEAKEIIKVLKSFNTFIYSRSSTFASYDHDTDEQAERMENLEIAIKNFKHKQPI